MLVKTHLMDHLVGALTTDVTGTLTSKWLYQVFAKYFVIVLTYICGRNYIDRIDFH